MTFIIGLVWGNGILIASDSRSTSGVIATEERKLHLIFRVLNSTEYDLAVVGGSGSASLVKQSYSLIDSILGGFIKREQRLPNSAEFDTLIDEVQDILAKRFYNLRSSGVESDVSLILGAITAECEPKLYVFDSTGVYEPRHESPGYAMIGIGKDTGGYLLLNLVGFSKEKAGKWDLGLLTTFLIDAISKVNPYVSPLTSEMDSIYLRCEGNKPVMGPLTPKAFLKYKESVNKRIEIFRIIWEVAEEVGEDRLIKALKRLNKNRNATQLKDG